MQLTQLPNPEAVSRIQEALQEQRISRYMPAAGGDVNLALQFYVWNCDICQAFYIPLHIAEVISRNAIHRCLLARLGENWCDHSVFKGILSHRMRSDLENAVAEERGQHGDDMTNHHVVSALGFGFWEHLLTKRFERLLWIRGMHHSFPGAANKRRADVHDLVERLRRWRNRIAHHQAIFDKSPTKKHQEVLALIQWVCTDTAAWVSSISKVPEIINLRPKVGE